MMRHITRVDLLSNVIDVLTVGAIAKDMVKYQIYNLKITVHRFYANIEFARKKLIQKNTVEIMFSKNMAVQNEDGKTLDLYGKVRFYSNGLYYTIFGKISIYAEYMDDEYDEKIRDYLYSYFTMMVETHPKIKRIFPFSFPDTLESYLAEQKTVVENQEYQWIDTGFPSIRKTQFGESPKSFLRFWDKNK